MPTASSPRVAEGLADAVVIAGTDVIAAIEALQSAPDDPDARARLAASGRDLRAAAHVARKCLAGAPADPFWERVVFFARAGWEVVCHERRGELLDRMGGRESYRRLAREQLGVHRRDWAVDLAFALPLRSGGALRSLLEETRIACAEADEAEAPRAWWSRQAASLRRAHKKVFEERLTKQVRRLRRRVDRCRWALPVLWGDEDAPAHAAAFGPIADALEEAEVACGLEDFLTDLAEAAPFKGSGALGSATRKAAIAACRRAQEARTHLLESWER
ncbi:MAG: hypothetical protein ACOCX4_02835 [Planctomycetota bacterium]